MAERSRAETLKRIDQRLAKHRLNHASWSALLAVAHAHEMPAQVIPRAPHVRTETVAGRTRIVLQLIERTDAEAMEARAKYAARCSSPATWWRAVRDGGDVRWLSVDFFDLATGLSGQAIGWWAKGGPWRQAPRGDRPVLLVYDPPMRRGQPRREGYRLAFQTQENDR